MRYTIPIGSLLIVRENRQSRTIEFPSTKELTIDSPKKIDKYYFEFEQSGWIVNVAIKDCISHDLQRKLL